MELFGLMLAIIFGPVAASLYCVFVEKVIARMKLLSRLLCWISSIIISLFIIEICLVVIFGPVETRRFVGRGFFKIHSFLFIAIAPALGAILLLTNRKIKLSKWYIATPICWITGIAAILYQYFITDSLYGPDCIGGPYTWPW